MLLSSGKNFKYKVLDSRTIEINSDILKVNYDDSGTSITHICMGDSIIKPGQELDAGLDTLPSKYKVLFIKAGLNGFAYIFTHIRNKCTDYLMPILEGIKSEYYYDSYLINAYLSADVTKLRLRYRFSKHEEYRKLEKFLCNHRLYIKTKDIDYDFVDYEFGISAEFDEDVTNFLDGKYSKFSPQLKINIGRFHALKARSRMILVLNKDESLKKEIESRLSVSIGDIDLDDRPKIDEEILDY